MLDSHIDMETSRLSTNVKGKRTKPSKLTSIFSLLLLIATFIIIVLITYIIIDKHAKKDNVCLTEHCVSVAARMIHSMNKSVNPCDDFYEFACGSWIESNPIPEDRVAITNFKKINDVMMLNLKVILETPITNETASDEVTMKTLYASCQNIDKINELDKRPLDDLFRKFGGSPMFNNSWRERDFNITDVLIKTKFIDSSIFKLQVGTDDEDSSKRIIRIEQGVIANLKSHYSDSKFEKTKVAYHELLFGLSRLLNPQPSNESLRRDLSEVILLESTLANITVKEEAKRQAKEYKIKTLQEMHELFREAFDFKRFIRGIFHPVFIPDNEPISVRTPEYVNLLPGIFKNTSKKALANFLSLQVAINHVDFLAQRILDIRLAYNRVISGTQMDKSRWVNCVTMTNENMGQTLGRLYVMKHFDRRAKEMAVEMIQDIKTAFLETVDEVEWMEESTKKVAKEKVMSMKEHIGYPDYIFNESFVAEEFKNLKFHKNTFFSNMVQFFETTEKNKLLALRDVVDRTRWVTYPSQINAYYSPNMNQLTFPAAILQFPFYHEENLKSLNFGGIGMVIGHEITHGFDDKGSLYDKDGNLKNWWPAKDREKFLNLTSCIIKQYNNYNINGINITLNGNLTQGENIADNGGLKQSFRAYQKWLQKHGPEPTLPGLPYNNQQLFYINFGQIWCGSTRPEQALQIAKLSKHSPGRFRVMGPLVNSDTFSEVFKCSPDSPMNPKDKCTVW